MNRCKMASKAKVHQHFSPPPVSGGGDFFYDAEISTIPASDAFSKYVLKVGMILVIIRCGKT